jgi:integrase
MKTKGTLFGRSFWARGYDDAKEQERRKNSDFLRYQDSSGRFADFHANRHTFITNLCKAEISPKTVQSLARHGDIRLTMNLYSHVDLEDQSAAISKLPGRSKRLTFNIVKNLTIFRNRSI